MYTIQIVKKITHTENCEIFEHNGSLLTNDIVLFDANMDTNVKRDKHLYFVDFSAPIVPYKVPEIPLLIEITLDNNKLTGQAKIQALKRLCDLEKENFSNLEQNSLIVVRQLKHASFQNDIQKRILLVCMTYLSSSIKDQMTQAKKFLDEIDNLSSQPLKKEELISFPNINQVEIKDLNSLVQKLVTEIENSGSLKVKIQDLYQRLCKANQEIIVMNHPVSPFKKEPEISITNIIEKMDLVVKEISEKCQKFNFELGDVLNIYETFTNENEDVQAVELEDMINKLLNPCYSYCPALDSAMRAQRELVLKEKDRGCAENCAKLKSYGIVFNQIQSFQTELNQFKTQFILIQSCIQSIRSIKDAFAENKRRETQDRPLNMALKICDSLVDRELIQRESFDTLFSNPILTKSGVLPGLKGPEIWPAPQQLVSSNGVERKQNVSSNQPSSDLVQELEEISSNHSFCDKHNNHLNVLSIKLQNFNNKMKDDKGIHAKGIVETLKKIEEHTSLDIQFKESQFKEETQDGKKENLIPSTDLVQKKEQEITKIKQTETGINLEERKKKEKEEVMKSKISFMSQFVDEYCLMQLRTQCNDLQTHLMDDHYQFEQLTLKALFIATSTAKEDSAILQIAITWLNNNKNIWNEPINWNSLK